MQQITHPNWDPTAARTAGALYLAIAVCGGFSIGLFFVSESAVATGGEAGEDGGAAGPTNGVTDEGFFKTSAAFGESVNVRGLDDGISVTTDRADCLVIGEEKETDSSSRLLSYTL